jgi:hypothetical protein
MGKGEVKPTPITEEELSASESNKLVRQTPPNFSEEALINIVSSRYNIMKK